MTDRRPKQRSTVEERVDLLEGDGDSSDSDLDIVRSSYREERGNDTLKKVIDDKSDAISISSDTDCESGVKQKRKFEQPKGQRVMFSDDDDDSDTVYTSFKKQKTKKVKNEKAPTIKRHYEGSSKSVVGLKPTKTSRTKRNGPRNHGDNDDSALMDESLPDYLQERYREWNERRDELGNAGLRIPPDDDDLHFSDDERMANLAEKPNLPTISPPAPYKDIDLPRSAGTIPAPIAQYLRDYQVKGAEFLHECFVYQKGGILGDDMGLGKTIQVIAFLTAAFGKFGDERDAKRMRKMRRTGDDRWYPRVLIVCPGGLMLNWRAELERWGWWHTFTYHGSPATKQEGLAMANNGRIEIMITTYSTYRINQSEINCLRWDCVIADECHIIKEKGSETTKAMNNVNALCRLGLSGTAIQNKYEELWTLLNWTNPGKFGPISTWKQMICIPLKLGQSHDATVGQLAKARRTAQKLVDNLLPSFFLRRTKKLIAHQLPKKSDRVVFCPLTEVQAEAYNNFCDSEMLHCIRDSYLPCNCRSGKKQGWCCYEMCNGQKWQSYVFPALITLQKLSNHVALLIPPGEADREIHDKEMEKMEMALPKLWNELYQQRDSILNYANQEFCGKWRVLKKLLKLWHDNGDKVLVFSHSVRLLKMLNLLFKATTTYNVSYLDGAMDYDSRQNQVDDFNSDPGQFVFLISTKAGGVGLNITSANKVVVMDPNWNPAYDLQAQDRAYRIGQVRDVEVFRLVSVGTVEEIVYARQIYKQQQANIGYNASVERRYFKGVQDQKEQKGEIFGLANLFAPLSSNVKLQDIVNKTNIAETKAGVEIAGLDLEAFKEDDAGESAFTGGLAEDMAMSQFAADIIDEPATRRKSAQEAAKRKDPVAAILAAAGVEYTHENAEVIGTSRIEMQISSRAQKAGNDIDHSNGAAFSNNAARPDESVNAADQLRTPGLGTAAYEDGKLSDPSAKIAYRWNPSEDIRKRQFCTMAKQFGYDDVTEFALVVEGWTQQQRRTCLDKFYRDRRDKLAA
ncbi:Hypothetical protein R9X50_00628800 [Acrodontium crateriforme]|uniref:Uncharacterized protein n=1 Tax=Acrodontium crateriforme TaxID=150365 RepID=A0AAQ3M9R8_9PEZI|nr:Hypothetical protein R9X50_00628800 [Acrodontium crateriforme]